MPFFKLIEMIKVYSIDANEAILQFRYGKTLIIANFRGGNRLSKRRATYTTDNPVAQFIIENDGRFGRTIKLERTVDNEAADKGNKGKGGKNAGKGPKLNLDSKKKIETVTDINGMREYLLKAGVPEESLMTMEDMEAAAESLAVEFPNLKK